MLQSIYVFACMWQRLNLICLVEICFIEQMIIFQTSTSPRPTRRQGGWADDFKDKKKGYAVFHNSSTFSFVLFEISQPSDNLNFVAAKTMKNLGKKFQMITFSFIR